MSRPLSRTLLGILAALLAGPLALAIHAIVFRPPLPPPGEYFLSSVLGKNYGLFTAGLYGVLGFLVQRFTRMRPSRIALAMIAVFPAVSCYEATRYPSSHNLIPFEFAIQLVWALPAFAGAWIAQHLAQTDSRSSSRITPNVALVLLITACAGLALRERQRSQSLSHLPKGPYWGVLAFAPRPGAQDSAKHRCKFSSFIRDLQNVVDSITVRSSASFERDGKRIVPAGESQLGDGSPWKLTLVRFPRSDSVELRAVGSASLTLAGRLTSADEASGVWECADSVRGAPDSLVLIEGEWVLRRGSWPGSELNWPASPRASASHPLPESKSSNSR